MQISGVSDDKAGVISGNYSLQVENHRPDVPQEFARTQIYQVPFEKGQFYIVKFKCRLFKAQSPVKLTCDGRSFEHKDISPVQWEWVLDQGVTQKEIRFTVPNCDDWYLAWTLHGAAAISIDDIQIFRGTGDE